MTKPKFCVDCKHSKLNHFTKRWECRRNGKKYDLVTGAAFTEYLDAEAERAHFTREDVNTPYAIALRCGPTGQFWKAREESDEATR